MLPSQFSSNLAAQSSSSMWPSLLRYSCSDSTVLCWESAGQQNARLASETYTYCGFSMHSCVGYTMLLQPACRSAGCYCLSVGNISCCHILSEKIPELSAVRPQAHVAVFGALGGHAFRAACVRPELDLGQHVAYMGIFGKSA